MTTDLPAKYKVALGSSITASCKLPEDLPAGTHIRVSASMQHVKIWVEDVLIEDIYRQPSFGLQPPEASAWYVLPLPEDAQGKTLTMEVSSQVGAFSGQVNSVVYGDPSALKYDIVARQPGSIVMAVTVLLVGALVFTGAVCLRSYNDSRFAYLGLFMMTTSLWLLSEMDLMQFVTGNRFVVGGISYMLLNVMTISLVLYLDAVVLSRFRKINYGLCAVFTVLYFVNLALQLTGTFYFIQTIAVTDIMIVVTLLIIIVLLMVEGKVYGNPLAWRNLFYLTLLMASIVIEVAMFFLGNYAETSSVGRVGLVGFFVLLVLDGGRHLNTIIAAESEAQTLRRMAYEDILTGGGNRASFEKAIDEWMGRGAGIQFRLVLLDMNGLKAINDQYGHLAGDEAIRSCFACLEEAFKDENHCYRLGGDEFACIMSSVEEEAYHQAISQFKNCMTQASVKHTFDISAAGASGVFTVGGRQSYSEFYHEVDNRMYCDKPYRRRKNP